MSETNRYREPRKLERATVSRAQIENATDRLVEMLMSDQHEALASAVSSMPADLHKPVILALTHRAAGWKR